MSGSTSKFALGYATAADAVTSLPSQEQSEAAWLDLLLGESGQATVNLPTPGTVATFVVPFARSYATVGITGAFCSLEHGASLASTNIFHMWLAGFTATQFTFQAVANFVVTGRPVLWRFFPRG